MSFALPPMSSGQSSNPQGPNSSGTPKPVTPHDSVDARPLTAPILDPSPKPLFPEFPDERLAVCKLQQIAATASGEKGEYLRNGAGSADRVEKSQAKKRSNEIRLRLRRDPQISEPVEGRVIRRSRLDGAGKPRVRAIFAPEDGGTSIHIDSEQLRGIPNGALITLNPSGRWGRDHAVVADTKEAHRVRNMVGVVEQRGETLVVKAKTRLSPILELPLVDTDPQLIGKTVIVDVRNPSSKDRVGIVHGEVDTTDDLKLAELTIAVDAGVAATFPPDVLAQVKKLIDSPPEFQLKSGMTDLRDKDFLATDNPGSRSDHRSVDPEQVSYVEPREGGGFILYDALADRRGLIAPDSPVDRHAFETILTFYGSGFDLPTLPKTLSEQLAVFVANQPRYATVVQTSYDENGEPIPKETQVYEALVKNRWAGSYREADRYYAKRDGKLTAEDMAIIGDPTQSLTLGLQKQLDLFEALGTALQGAAKERGMRVNRQDDRYTAEKAREQFSLCTNAAVDEIITRAGGDAIHRYDPEAKEAKKDKFRNFVAALDKHWPMDQTLDGYLNELDPKDSHTPSIVSESYRLYERAYFSVEESGHDGIKSEFYAQSSAANRRGLDQRNLEQAKVAHRILNKGENIPFPHSAKSLGREAERGNQWELLHERVIDGAVDQIRYAAMLKPHVGKIVEATVRRINPGGLMVVTKDPATRLFIPARALGQALGTRFETTNFNTLLASEDGHQFRIGDRLSLRVDLADKDLGLIEVMPADLIEPDWRDQLRPKNPRRPRRD